ncbi:MAG TPA: hypothetical protein PLQ04_04680 [Lachnospiraceae bacterium]|nr:hypothetical protein [Lachnospiraceae bacterium]
MADGKTVKEMITEEKLKWKDMDKKQRLKYFKDYYLVKCIVGLIALAMVVSIFCETVLFHKDPIYTGYEVNVYASDEGMQFLTEDYLEYLGGNEAHQEVVLAECYIDFYAEEQVMDSNTDQMVLYAQAAAGEYDYLLMNEEALIAAKDMDIYADLEANLSEHWLEVLDGRMISLEIGGFTYPVAIDLTNTEFARKCGYDEEDIYLAFNCIDIDAEAANQFLDYILADSF